jgi:diguanylate cyclase (GGDEF)-like protein
VARFLRPLWRPLAADERRVPYWRRHVRIGVLLSEVASVAVVPYVLRTPTPAHHSAAVLAVAALVVVASPLLLVLPLDDLLRDHRGAGLFAVWAALDTAVVTVVARLDGGGSSPVATLLFLSLAFIAVAFPREGVLVLGACMTAVYLGVICGADTDTHDAFVAVVLGVFTVVCALSSGNQWEAYDEQVALLRTQERLAATDPLTGTLNRRAFLARLDGVLGVGAAGRDAAVCLVDLDGFKAVNDTGGHAAGDALLCAVAQALAGALRASDTVARLGGDEFAVLVVEDDVQPGAVAERVRAAIARAGSAAGVTASVGATSVQPGDGVLDLLRRADTAMYRAKTGGGDRTSSAGG